MTKLKAIKSTYKSGDEPLVCDGKDLPYTLLDFWRWSASDILSNATRGKFAEFIVASALDVNLQEPSNEWSAYDLLTKDGLKIEVKTSAYIQVWNQKEYSKPIFSISEAKHWDAETGMTTKEPKRHADVYVFCLLKEKDQDIIDPIKMEQWEFYVVPTKILNEYKRSQQSITLPSLRKLTESIPYNDLENKCREL